MASDAVSDIERTRINAWFDQNVVQRLDDKRTGAIIVVMQRLLDEDLTGQPASETVFAERHGPLAALSGRARRRGT